MVTNGEFLEIPAVSDILQMEIERRKVVLIPRANPTAMEFREFSADEWTLFGENSDYSVLCPQCCHQYFVTVTSPDNGETVIALETDGVYAALQRWYDMNEYSCIFGIRYVKGIPMVLSQVRGFCISKDQQKKCERLCREYLGVY